MRGADPLSKLLFEQTLRRSAPNIIAFAPRLRRKKKNERHLVFKIHVILRYRFIATRLRNLTIVISYFWILFPYEIYHIKMSTFPMTGELSFFFFSLLSDIISRMAAVTVVVAADKMRERVTEHLLKFHKIFTVWHLFKFDILIVVIR